MQDENKIIEILSEILIEMQGMRVGNRDLQSELVEIKVGMSQMSDSINKRLDRSDEIQAGYSLAIKELRL